MIEISETQRLVVEFVIAYKLNPSHNGFSPSLTEIAESLSYGRTTIHNAIREYLFRCLKGGVSPEIDLDDRGRIIVPDVVIYRRSQNPKISEFAKVGK